MEKNGWNKVLLTVFKKSRFQGTEVVPRDLVTEGYDLLGQLPNWSTKVLVEKADDEGIVTNKFTLRPGEEAKIEEYQTWEFSSMNGWSKMYFRLGGNTRPMLVVSFITSVYDTYYYDKVDVGPEMLDSGADISAMLPDGGGVLFPDLKARYGADGAIEIEFEGKKTVLDAGHREFFSPTRDFGSVAARIEGDKVDLDKDARVRIEYIN